MIYFDNAATTPLCDSAREVLINHDFGNPSSPHMLGLAAERAIKKAARDIGSILSCSGEEIIFTSGGTESNNLGILGAAAALKFARNRNLNIHILASNHEHPSVAEPLKYLSSLQGYTVTFAEPSSFKSHICDETAMICISQVSSETGDIFDIKKIFDGVIFVDGAQGFCKVAPPKYADIYSFSGHKIRGPMGAGGLMVKKGVRIQPLFYGGGQQQNLRPGTENVPGILAMAAAAKERQDHDKILRIKNILSDLGDINQAAEQASPYILNMSFKGIRGETLTNLLSAKGVCVSMGAACQTGKKKLTLVNMGFSKERAESAIRFSFSSANTEEEALQAKEIIKECLAELKK